VGCECAGRAPTKALLEKMTMRMRNKNMYNAWSSWDMPVRESQREMALVDKMKRIRRCAEMWMTRTSWYDKEELAGEDDSTVSKQEHAQGMALVGYVFEGDAPTTKLISRIA
jgi:hypothetical protein